MSYETARRGQRIEGRTNWALGRGMLKKEAIAPSARFTMEKLSKREMIRECMLFTTITENRSAPTFFLSQYEKNANKNSTVYCMS